MDLKGKYCKDCKVFTDNIDADALSLIYSFVNHPMFEGSKIRIMPDVHAGRDIVVGFTVPFADHVNPDHVGGDIGCTVSTSITDIPVRKEDFVEIEKRIREHVVFGMDSQPDIFYNVHEMCSYIAKCHSMARTVWPDYVGPIDLSERGISKWLQKIEMDGATFYRQIGTVGGGNHFVEIGITPDGNYAMTAHCGSRNLGQKVWKYWHKIARNPGMVRVTGYLEEEQMRGYITDMVVAQAYASFNHMQIQRLLLDVLRRVGGRHGGNVLESIITTHNYIDFRSRIMRKGAVAALKGEKLVIPFNMRDGLIVCHGKSNNDWNCSAPHGAGRLIKRGDAKELIDLEEFEESMKDVYSTSVGRGTIDESPMAYKDTDEIIRLIKDTVAVDYFIKPVINLKAMSSVVTDEEKD